MIVKVNCQQEANIRINFIWVVAFSLIEHNLLMYAYNTTQYALIYTHTQTHTHVHNIYKHTTCTMKIHMNSWSYNKITLRNTKVSTYKLQ